MAKRENSISRRERPNHWKLPTVLNVTSSRVRYSKPQQRLVGLEIVEASEAAEIVVDTNDEFPVRALSPVLYVGDIPIPHYKWISKNKYRFIEFDFQKLQEGAPISLGWPGRSNTKVETRFRYHSGAQPLA